MAADFTPNLNPYSGQGSFRFWVQKVLPLVYDDSLSYYELLCKVVTFLNNVIQDMDTAEENIELIKDAYNQLQNYVNTYFDNLDIEAELDAILMKWVEDGRLEDALTTTLTDNPTLLNGPVSEAIPGVVSEQLPSVVAGQIDGVVTPLIPDAVSDWLDENVQPTTPVVDESLTISGAAADAEVVGKRLGLLDDLVYTESALEQSAWWNKGLSSTSGNTSDSTIRISTIDYISDVSKYVVPNTGYEIAVFAYDSNNAYQGTWNGTAWQKTSIVWNANKIVLGLLPPQDNYKILARRSDNQDISLSESANIIFGNNAIAEIGRAKNLTSADDIDNITTPGVYYWSSSRPINAPTAAGIMTVDGSESAFSQSIISGQGNIRTRYYNGVFTDWYVAADRAVVDTLSQTVDNVNKQVDVLTDITFDTEYEINLGLEQGGINTKTGANYGTTTADCRTGYLTVPQQDLLVTFNNPDYLWVCWSYSGTTGGSARHINGLGAYHSTTYPIPVKFASGDKNIRIGFRRADGQAMTQDLTDPTSDWSIISSGVKILYNQGTNYDVETINLIDINSLASTSTVTVTHNANGSVTLTNVNASPNQLYQITGLVTNNLVIGKNYVLRMKIDSCSAVDSLSTEQTPYIYLRFRGTYQGATRLGLGIGVMTKPGDYASMYYATGYESGLYIDLTGSQSIFTTVTISELMVAESEICLPYIPYGLTAEDLNTYAIAKGTLNDTTSWGVSNAIASARQYTNIKWTPVGNVPSQFSEINYVFRANSEVQGLPYSSARMVDKLIGTHISLHTFMTALKNPRSVLYTRRLTYNNARTYYGCVCSAFVNHNYGIKVNYTTSDYREFDRLEPIPYTAIRKGDIGIMRGHMMFITDVCRDDYGRIINVCISEAGTPVVHAILSYNWNRFVTFANNAHYDMYRYKDIDNVQYTPLDYVKGYYDETLPEVVYPDIMSEYGDKAAFIEGETVTVNVLSTSGYSTITVKKDDSVIDTKTSLVDFTMSNLAPGFYEIDMTGSNKSTSTTFVVAQATCSYDQSTHILRFSSTNANPVAIYTYNDVQSDGGCGNKVCEFTDADVEAGMIDLTEWATGTMQNAKVGFEVTGYEDYGVATWHSGSLSQYWTTV